MRDATGEAGRGGLRVTFDRRLKLEFHGSTVTSDAGLLAFRELDDALGLTQMAGEVLSDTRTGKNGRHSLMAQLRQSVFGRLAGYEDVNDADGLGCDPAMRWVVGGRAVIAQAASTSQMGRFETGAMTSAQNLTALADLSGRWIDRVPAWRPGTALVLDIDSSVSPTYGAQEGTAYNGHFACTCQLRLSIHRSPGLCRGFLDTQGNMIMQVRKRLLSITLALLLMLSSSVALARTCKHGNPCGNSCIAKEKTCHSSVAHNRHGKIERSKEARALFEKAHPCPSTGRTSGTCPDYVVDHVASLKRGGADAPSNMQWQTKEEAKAKDKWE